MNNFLNFAAFTDNDSPPIHCAPPGQLATVIYNRRFTGHDGSTCGETFIPPASQLRSKKVIHHGRQIPKIKPEEIHTETKQDQSCQRKSKGGRGGQASRGQEEISGSPIISLELIRKRDEFSSCETSTRPDLEMRRRIRPHCSPRTARSRIQIRIEPQVFRRQTCAYKQKGFLPPAQRRDARRPCLRKTLTAANGDGLNFLSRLY